LEVFLSLLWPVFEDAAIFFSYAFFRKCYTFSLTKCGFGHNLKDFFHKLIGYPGSLPTPNANWVVVFMAVIVKNSAGHVQVLVLPF
jgi:hypothetical protein